MKNDVENNCCHELDSEIRMEGSVTECLDQMQAEIIDLADRLHQVMAISIVARRGLEQTLDCSCCAEEILAGTFRAIESIACCHNR